MPSEYNIIGNVTSALESLLSELTPSLDSPADLQVTDNNDGGRINIYLYQVLENAHAKNREWSSRPNGDLHYPPLALNLYYLLTPYAPEQSAAHHILGDAMRTLHDHALIRGSDLPESLRPVTDQLAIVLVPMQLEELTRIWNALHSAYKLSVAYEVRIVTLQSNIEQTPSRVMDRLDRYARL